ncbi:MAG: endo-1,4-beta-xylanase [Spirochaetota bacterium]
MRAMKPGTALSVIALIGALAMLLWSCASTGSEPDEQGETIVYEEGFESSLGGWSGRGPETIQLSGEHARSGSQSAKISGRTSTWNGPIREVTTALRPGSTYRIGAWALFTEGPDSQFINVSVQQSPDGEGETYTTVGSGNLVKGEWAYIEGVFTVPRSEFVVPVSLYFETPYKEDGEAESDDLIDFYIDDVSITKMPPPPPPEAETDIPAFHTFFDGFTVGTAVKRGYLNPNNDHHELLRHFNFFVYENEMKMDAMQPVEGQFRFDNADRLLEYTEARGVDVRGHTLVWHSQHPGWFFTDSGGSTVSREVLLERIRTHVQTIVSRYAGRVKYWDVANEVIGDDGELRDSQYLQIVGSDEYIRRAFEWAHEADPDARLFINDYNVSFSGPKQDALYELVRDLKEDGVPIHGVGMQMHVRLGHPPVYEVENAIERFASLGVEVHVTELDVSVYESADEAQKMGDDQLLVRQANRYARLFRVFGEQAALGNLQNVTIWGISDGDSWKNSHPTPGRDDYPLLFGRDLRAKPAYWIFADPERLPIFIKSANAINVQGEMDGPDSEAWDYASPMEITDRVGNLYGTFRAVWEPDSLHILATVDDATPEDTDGVTLFMEPYNVKSETLTQGVQTVEVSRAESVSDDGERYTVLATIPLTQGEGVAGHRVGFDLRITDGDEFRSWNDHTHAQEQATENYGTVVMTELPPMGFAQQGTPEIDAEIDAIWDEITPTPMLVETEGVTAEGSTFRVLWDEQYVYVLFEVVDPVLNDDSPNAYEQDSVEVFIDENNAKTSTYQSDDAQYRVSFRNHQSFNGGDESRFRSAAATTSDGYRVEVAVPFTEIEPSAGTVIGFDVQINEADASGARTGIRNWVNDTNMGFQDTSGFGVLMLE